MIGKLTVFPKVYKFTQRILVDDQLTERIVMKYLDYQNGMRILDFGCGVGLYAHLFSDEDYCGVDILPQYLSSARNRYPKKEFIDSKDLMQVAKKRPFDRILVLGVFHHMSDEEIKSVLQTFRSISSPDAKVVVLEAIYPENKFDIPGWLLRKMDRGNYVRHISTWNHLFEKENISINFTPYYNKLLPCIAGTLKFL